MDGNFPISGIEYKLVGKRIFLLTSQRPLRVLSSAVMGNELKVARHILNYTVDTNYDCSHPLEKLINVRNNLSLEDDVVGMMTAVWVEDTALDFQKIDELAVAAFCTAGVSNRAAAGLSLEVISKNYKPGTINSIVLIDGNLTPAAMVNSVITATEAKVRALYEYGLRLDDGKIVTGTTSDAITIACTGNGAEIKYAGTATPLGFLIGKTVYNAVQAGLDKYFKKKK